MATLEICTESVADCRAAQAAGADRIELCAALSEGGVTPSRGALEAALERTRLPIVVLVRPRRGDFLYDEEELDALLRDVRGAVEAGAAGVAAGVLRPDGTVDRERMAAVVAAARPGTVTFHRAFDATRDAREALETLAELGVDRVLSAGGRASALEGAETLAELVRLAGRRLAVVAAGGVRSANAAELVRRTGVRELHSSAAGVRPSAMEHRGPALGLEAVARLDETERRVVDPAEIRRLRRALAGS